MYNSYIYAITFLNSKRPENFYSGQWFSSILCLKQFIKSIHDFCCISYYAIIGLIEYLSLFIFVDVDYQLALSHTDYEVSCA